MILYSVVENNPNIKFQAIKVSYHQFKVRIYLPTPTAKLHIISPKMIIIKDRMFLERLDMFPCNNNSL